MSQKVSLSKNQREKVLRLVTFCIINNGLCILIEIGCKGAWKFRWLTMHWHCSVDQKPESCSARCCTSIPYMILPFPKCFQNWKSVAQQVDKAIKQAVIAGEDRVLVIIGWIVVDFFSCFLFFSPLWLVAGNTIANYTIRLNNLPVSTNSRATLNLVNPGKELFSYSLLGQNCGALLISQFKHHLNSSTWISLILLQLSSITVLSFYIWIKLSFCASRDRLVQQVLEIYRCLSPGQSYGNVC